MKLQNTFKAIIRSLLISLILFSTQGCATSFLRLSTKHTGIDPEFQQTYEYFYTLTSLPKEKLTIGFVDNISMPLSDIILGTSNRVIFGGYEIDISRVEWVKLSYAERDFLILHEMGHAVCKLPHSDYNPNYILKILESIMVLFGQMTIRENFSDGCASNIMTTLIPTTMCIQRHYLNYMVSLQEGCKNAKPRN